MTEHNPLEALAHLRHEFGEHGGVNMSIEASSTFTVMEPGTMPEMFQGLKGHDAGCYLYGRHFNPTVYNLGRQLAALDAPAIILGGEGPGLDAATLQRATHRLRIPMHDAVESLSVGAAAAVLLFEWRRDRA